MGIFQSKQNKQTKQNSPAGLLRQAREERQPCEKERASLQVQRSYLLSCEMVLK